MGATRSEFEVAIKTTADLAGAKDTSTELDKVAASAKGSGDNLSGAASAAKSLGDASEETKGKVKQHGEALDEGGKHAELFGEKHHEAHAAVKALGEVLPGVGGLAREMFNPATLAIGLFGLGIEKLIEHFHNLSEAEEAFLKGAAQGVGNRLREQSGAAADAAADMQKFADAVGSAASGEVSLDKAMSNKIALFDNYIAGLKKVERAEDEAEEARIKRAERERLITPEQADAQLQALHGRAETRDAAHTDEQAQFKLDQEKATLAKAQQDLPALKQAAEDAAAKARAAAANQSNAATRAGEGKGSEFEQLYGEGGTKENPKPESPQGKLNAAQDAVDAANRRETEGHKSLATGGWGAVEAGLGLGLENAGILPDSKQAQAKLDDAQREVTQLQKAVEEAKKETERKAAEAQAAKDAADAANKRFEDANSTIKNLGGYDGAVSVDAAKLEQDRAAAAEVARIKGQSTSAGAADTSAFRSVLDPEAAGMVQHAQGMLNASRNIAPLSPASHPAIKELTEVIAQLTAELAKFTRAGVPDDEHLGAQVKALKQEVEWLKSGMAANASH